MKSTSSESQRNKRLAAVAFLRSSHGQNTERLSQVNQILNGAPSSIRSTDSSTADNTMQRRVESSFWRSFRIRFACSIVLTIILYLAMMTNSPKIAPYLEVVKVTVTTDYSENLFDFFHQIPYTLDYEKINVEG